MKIVEATKSNMVEKLSPLKLVPVGSVFRHRDVSFEDAVKGVNENCFWMVIASQPPAKPGRVTCISTDGKLLVERDDFHMVVVHPAAMVIHQAEKVESE